MQQGVAYTVTALMLAHDSIAKHALKNPGLLLQPCITEEAKTCPLAALSAALH